MTGPELYALVRERFGVDGLNIAFDAVDVVMRAGSRVLWRVDRIRLDRAMMRDGDRGVQCLIAELTEAALRPSLTFPADDLGNPVEP